MIARGFIRRVQSSEALASLVSPLGESQERDGALAATTRVAPMNDRRA